MALFTVLHTAMPYCLQRQQSGKWVLLNREYKPLGFFTKTHQTYSNYPIEIDIAGLTPAVAEKLSAKPYNGGDTIYLYNDGCVPTHSQENMTHYMERLAILGGLKLDPSALN